MFNIDQAVEYETPKCCAKVVAAIPRLSFATRYTHRNHFVRGILLLWKIVPEVINRCLAMTGLTLKDGYL